MLSLSWQKAISPNDRKSNVLRLTEAEDMLPDDCFIMGTSPDPYAPPAGLTPLEIIWADGTLTKHFLRGDTNRCMITGRTDAVRNFYDSIGPDISHIVITAVSSRKFALTPLKNP
jgi:hypothetical protein